MWMHLKVKEREIWAKLETAGSLKFSFCSALFVLLEKSISLMDCVMTDSYPEGNDILVAAADVVIDFQTNPRAFE